MKKILFALLAATMLIGCQEKQKQIGVIIPMTGAYSDVGHWMQMGIDLAVEDLALKGINVSPLYEDSQSSPTTAISAYQKLKTLNGVTHYISTVSSVCLALKPIIYKDNTFLFVNAGHKQLITDDLKIHNIYRHALTIPQEASFLAAKIKENYHNNLNIALLYTNNDIGVEFNEVFRSQFSDDVHINSISYGEAETNLKNIVQKLNSQEPDIYVIYGYTRNFAQLIKTIREQGFNSAIYANQGFSTPSVIANTGLAGNNVFYSDYDIPQNADMQLLNQRALKKYNENLSPMAIASYNIMYMIGTTLSQTTSNNIDDFKTIMSTMDNIDINGMNISIESGEAYIPLKLVENVFEK